MIQCLLWEILTAAQDLAEEEVLQEEALTEEMCEALLRCIRLSATIAIKTAKCLFGRQAANLFSAVIVLRTKKVLVREDLKAGMSQGSKDLMSVKCLMRFAMIAEMTVKCLFVQAAKNPFFAVIVLVIKKATEKETGNKLLLSHSKTRNLNC